MLQKDGREDQMEVDEDAEEGEAEDQQYNYHGGIEGIQPITIVPVQDQCKYSRYSAHLSCLNLVDYMSY